jgi:hypothetical protein
MKRSIRRWRAIPGIKIEIVLSEAHKNDANGNRFLFRESGGSDRILIFATDNNLQVGVKYLHLLYCLFVDTGNHISYKLLEASNV